MDVAFLNRPHPSSVGADHGRIFKPASRYGLPYLSAHSRRLDSGYNSLLYQLRYRIMGRPQGTGAYRNVFNPQGRHRLHHQIHHVVSITEMVMK